MVAAAAAAGTSRLSNFCIEPNNQLRCSSRSPPNKGTDLMKPFISKVNQQVVRLQEDLLVVTIYEFNL